MSIKAKKIRIGGRGKRFEDRNRELVELRLKDPKTYSYGRLGIIFTLNKKTAREIFLRDRNRYTKDEVGITTA